MLVALGLPLTITLQRRATAELEREALIEAQGIAAAIDPGDVDDPEKLQTILDQAAAQVGGWVIVVDENGVLTADSDGPAERGTFFATPGRPEIELALNGTPNSEIRDSQDLSEDIMATAVPIPDESRIVGAVRVTRSVQHVNDRVRTSRSVCSRSAARRCSPACCWRSVSRDRSLDRWPASPARHGDSGREICRRERKTSAVLRRSREKWGGSLEVKSAPGEGTRVEVTLNLAAP